MNLLHVVEGLILWTLMSIIIGPIIGTALDRLGRSTDGLT